MATFLIIMFRIGNTTKDEGKIGYKESKIRMLDLDEEHIAVIRRNYEVKHRIATISNETEIY